MTTGTLTGTFTYPTYDNLTVTGALNMPLLEIRDRVSEPILTITDKGMTYKGVFIEDAGEAHRAFIAAMGETTSYR